MRTLLVSILSFCFFFNASASHITGGEMFYVFNGMSNGQYQYNVTLKLLMRCNSGRQFNDPAVISFFNKSTNSRFLDVSVPLTRKQTVELADFNRCISNPPTVCYEVGYYEFSTSLPPSPDGYIITGQFIYRVAGINNLITSSSIGATYTAEIPGNQAIPAGPTNTSAAFVGSDLVVICAGSPFNYSFAAVDSDGDNLRYSFCDAYQGGVNGGANTSSPPAAPPYQPVPYTSVYTGSSPLGSKVVIDPNSGYITGIAPDDAGIYVVTVCVSEIRNGLVIATQRKDIQINIAPCTIAGAKLQREYMLCKDTKTISLSNLSVSPLIVTQHWEFIDNKGVSLYTSDLEKVSYSFPDTGIFTIKLIVNKGIECSDSTTAVARVYPGFILDFNWKGVCYKKPTTFTDATTSVYGAINFWNWEFGEDDIALSFSDKKNPFYTYAAIGAKSVRLISGNSFGCLDTLFKNVLIYDKPPITLSFRDSLICVKDMVQLQARGKGNFRWTPLQDIRDDKSATPTVSPPTTTTYFVDLDDDGCLNRDSVKVQVTDHVSLQVMNDTTICKGDTVQLLITSDGFKYSWSPVSQVINPSLKNASVVSLVNTSYQVTAAIGGCTASARIAVNPVPYPLVNAGVDTTICYRSFAQLNGTMNGISFTWSPVSTLINANLLNPAARPTATTKYVLYAYDNKGCPKAGTDTVVVTVLPQIHPFAGRDTSVVVSQSLQLHATGGVDYLWLPATGLSANNIADPLALYNMPFGGLKYKLLVYNQSHCVDSAFMEVNVFKTLPSVFVPNAFSPNGDGSNDLLRPIAVGMHLLEYFNVYNRWGQMVYSSGINNTGWDGSQAGKPQDPGKFVWVVKAIDYTGKAYFQKGTVLLVR
ncbi:MAG: gliding motility-associated C-terminal domain-containing protein [Chitinophagaceae bacterium]